MTPEAIILNGTWTERLILAGACVLISLVIFIYIRFSKKRWISILAESLNYHRFHLNVIVREKTADDKNREVARAMLWAIDKQFPVDCREGLGFKTFLKAYTGQKNSLLIMSEVFYQVARYYYQIDKRVPRLMYTLHSTLSRRTIIESIFAPLALPYMDIFLLLTVAGIARSGKSRMYRDFSRQIRKGD